MCSTYSDDVDETDEKKKISLCTGYAGDGSLSARSAELLSFSFSGLLPLAASWRLVPRKRLPAARLIHFRPAALAGPWCSHGLSRLAAGLGWSVSRNESDSLPDGRIRHDNPTVCVTAPSSVSASLCVSVHLSLIIKLKMPPVMVLGTPLDSL